LSFIHLAAERNLRKCVYNNSWYLVMFLVVTCGTEIEAIHTERDRGTL
jgi:hypothetical protein